MENLLIIPLFYFMVCGVLLMVLSLIVIRGRILVYVSKVGFRNCFVPGLECDSNYFRFSKKVNFIYLICKDRFYILNNLYAG